MKVHCQTRSWCAILDGLQEAGAAQDSPAHMAAAEKAGNGSEVQSGGRLTAALSREEPRQKGESRASSPLAHRRWFKNAEQQSAFICAGLCSLVFLCLFPSTVLCCTCHEAGQDENTFQSHQMQGISRNDCMVIFYHTHFQYRRCRHHHDGPRFMKVRIQVQYPTGVVPQHLSSVEAYDDLREQTIRCPFRYALPLQISRPWREFRSGRGGAPSSHLSSATTRRLRWRECRSASGSRGPRVAPAGWPPWELGSPLAGQIW